MSYVQVAKFIIRKTAASDHGELALARNLRAKLGPGKPTEHRRKNIAKKPARRRVARIDDEVRSPQEFPQYDRYPAGGRLSAPAHLWPRLNACTICRSNESSFGGSAATTSRSTQSRGPGTPGEWIRLAAPRMDFARAIAPPRPLPLSPCLSRLR